MYEQVIARAQINERLREAEQGRLGRLARVDSRAPGSRSWSIRMRRRLGSQLVAAGEALRQSAEERSAAGIRVTN